MDTPDISTTLGIAIICRQDGEILKVLSGCDTVKSSRNFMEMVDSENKRKAQYFLNAISENKNAFGWEMNVNHLEQVIPYHFAGSIYDDKLFVLASQTNSGLTLLYEELTRVNNEQANALRIALKDLTSEILRNEDRKSRFYNEMTLLNNELSNTQRELTKKNIELEQLYSQLNELLGIAAHDLRNPLGVIMGFSEFILQHEKDCLPDEFRVMLEDIYGSSEFMLNMVNDLLDISKIQSGKLHLDMQPVNIVELTRNTVSLNRPMAKNKKIAIHLEIDPNLPESAKFMMLDPRKMQQVLTNLISNAIKYSHENTRILICLHYLTKESKNRISLAEKNADQLMISVADQGQGIPEDEIDQLFKAFQTTSVRGTAGEISTGLGLHIVRRIVQGHNGRILVESRVNKGTTFTVVLPLVMHPG